jgi:hypothetical protein
MSNLTDYAEKKLNDHILGITSYTKPTAAYASLHTASPTDTGSHANELTATGYSRVSITASMNATNATSGLADNATAIEIGPVTADAGTVTHAGIEDAATVGNMLLWVQNTASRTLLNGDSFRWAANQLSVTFA